MYFEIQRLYYIMLKIIVNAYTVCPDMGSEPGVGWNWCVNIAKYCELHIITESEYKDKIVARLKQIPYGENMHFYWNEVTPKIRRMCWNQGDWRFYYYYRKWQLKTADIARGIVENLRAARGGTDDIILHQLNMIGFREPGYLWKVAKEYDIPFVWGPIGGLKLFPMSYSEGKGLKMKVFNKLKSNITKYQIRSNSRVCRALHTADALIASIPESHDAIKKYHNLESIVIPETGCFLNETDCVDKTDVNNRFFKSELNVLWVGKFDFRKRLDIAIRAIAKAEKNVNMTVLGSGNVKQVEKAKNLCRMLNVADRVHFLGNRSNPEVKKMMSEADVFLFTSVNEDTSTVVLEAISSNLPVLCFDTCGMAAVIDETVGFKVPLTQPQRSVSDFADKLNFFNTHRDELLRLSNGCPARAVALSWDNKALQVLAIYNEIVKKRKINR